MKNLMGGDVFKAFIRKPIQRDIMIPACREGLGRPVTSGCEGAKMLLWVCCLICFS